MSKRTGIMLAKALTERLLAQMPEQVVVQPKLDGDRCRALPTEAGYNLVSSQGNSRNAAVPHIVEQLNAIADAMCPRPWPALDGELYIHGVSHQQIRSIASRTVNLHPDHRRITYQCFDIIDDQPQVRRLGRMFQIFNPLETSVAAVERVETYKVENTLERAMFAMNRFLDAGYEGVIVRNPLGMYEMKRSNNLLKLKPDKTGWAFILSMEEAISLQGEPKGMTGAFLVRFNDIVFKVSAGRLTHAERTTAWQNPDLIHHKWVKFRYLMLTDAGIPREPTAMHIADEPEE